MRSLIRHASLTDWLLVAPLVVNVLGFAALLYRLSQPMPILDPISVMIEKP